MKITVTGKGVVPGIGALAPVYNREADISLVKRILAFRVFRVFNSETGLQITLQNVDEYIERDITSIINETPVIVEETKVVETRTVVEDEVTVDESVYEVNTDDGDIVVAESEDISIPEVTEDQYVVNTDITTHDEDNVIVETTNVEESIADVDTSTTATTTDTVIENPVKETTEPTVDSSYKYKRKKNKRHN